MVRLLLNRKADPAITENVCPYCCTISSYLSYTLFLSLYVHTWKNNVSICTIWREIIITKKELKMFQTKGHLPLHVLSSRATGAAIVPLQLLLRAGDKNVRLIPDKARTSIIYEDINKEKMPLNYSLKDSISEERWPEWKFHPMTLIKTKKNNSRLMNVAGRQYSPFSSRRGRKPWRVQRFAWSID